MFRYLLNAGNTTVCWPFAMPSVRLLPHFSTVTMPAWDHNGPGMTPYVYFFYFLMVYI